MGERPTLLMTTRLGVRPLGVRGEPLHSVAGQLLSVIRRRLGDGPADLLAEPGDPIAATADAAPAARGADRAAAGHPLTGALPAGLGHRLAEAVSQFPDRPVEITLSPEELGRVRLTLTTHDGALTMMIQADRPETLDLLRRNIDSLAQDFRDLGYQDLTFSFGQERNPRQSPDAGPLIALAETDAPPAPAAIGAPGHDRTRLVADGGGLDLRL